MASKKVIVLVAALLVVAVALEAAPRVSAAMDCKAGCAELKDSPLGGAADCEKKCLEIAATKGPTDPNKAAKWDIP